MSTKREVVLSLDKVSLRIPVFSKTELSLKKSFHLVKKVNIKLNNNNNEDINGAEANKKMPNLNANNPDL